MKVLKNIFLISLLLLLVGFIIFVVALAASGWDIKKLSTIKLEEETYDAATDADINEIFIDFGNADIEVAFGDSLSVSYPVSYTRSGKAASRVLINDDGGVLSIKEKRSWFLNIGFNFTNPKVYLTIPKSDDTIKLNLDTNNGNVRINGTDKLEAIGALEIDTDNGNISLISIKSNKINLSLDNGNVLLKNVTSFGEIKTETDNGNVDFENVYAEGAVKIDTDNGDVEFKGSVKAKRIEIDTDNGDASLEDAVTDADEVKITSDNGDVELLAAGGKEEYTIIIETDNGDKNISSSAGGAKIIDIETDNGDIEVYFEK